jgi:hypothetical protein
MTETQGADSVPVPAADDVEDLEQMLADRRSKLESLRQGRQEVEASQAAELRKLELQRELARLDAAISEEERLFQRSSGPSGEGGVAAARALMEAAQAAALAQLGALNDEGQKATLEGEGQDTPVVSGSAAPQPRVEPVPMPGPVEVPSIPTQTGVKEGSN